MKKNILYKTIVLSSILAVSSCKVNMQKQATVTKEAAKSTTAEYNEENPYIDAYNTAGHRSNIEAYYKSNTPSKI